MSDTVSDKKILPFGLKDTKQGSQLDQHKITAFQIAPTRKTAFEKSREEAQRKAEREAAETAAAYQDFVAEYGEAESSGRTSLGNRSNRNRQTSNEAWNDSDYRHEQRKRGRQEPQVGNNSSQHDQDDNDSENEERERRRIKLKSSSNFLNELKQNNRRYPAQRLPQRDSDRPPHHANVRPTTAIQGAVSATDRPKHETDHEEPINEEEDESGDDVDYYRTRPSAMAADRPLNKIHRARLKFLLDTTTAKRGSIARMTAFAMTHASSVVEIANRICDGVAESGVDWKISVARLWCVSDILHNSWVPIPNVWKYRGAFEERLESVVEAMLRLGDTIESRIRRENYRRLVTGVLEVWSTWICFSNGFVDKLFDAFDDTPEVQETVAAAQKEEKKGGGWRKLGDTLPADEQKESTSVATSKEESAKLDGHIVDLDGQEVDLDGEEFDLDGEDDLEDDKRENAEKLAPTTLTALETKPIDIVPDNFDRPNTSGKPLPSTSTKVKMSFGKFSIPKKPVTVVQESLSDTDTIHNKLEEYERLAAESTTAAQIQDEKSSKSPGAVAEVVRKGRPMRRSAADFMD